MTKSIKLQNELQASEFHTLDDETRSFILTKTIDADHRMRLMGQTELVWDGPLPEEDIINREIAAQTEKGEIVGKAIYFGKILDSGAFKRSVYVYVPGSGSVWEVDPKTVRLANDDDQRRMKNEIKMGLTLIKTEEKIKELIKVKKTKKVVGSHLVDDMLQTAKNMGLCVEELASYYRIFGNKKKVAVYLSIKGARADLSGFDLDHVAINKISEEEAKERHLGKVRGQINFHANRNDIFDAWDQALKFLG